ncbi:MAG: RNA polymerase subunit sigma-70 [Alphaproteobacteria bacterium HGW-Alphaproteobacteria-10]|nr:MAG: RNA polymerase subunit sigma-70 [Alphaproteobacteria bacterium HGW-Alphaproteobacteria-10]
MPYPGRGKQAWGLRRVGGLDDLPGGGQIVVAGDHAFVGHMDPPFGTSIIDVSDPSAPRVVAQLKLPDDSSHTHKVRVVGDLMYVNVEQADRHFKRRAARIAPETQSLTADLGRAPTEAELAARLGVAPERMDALRAAQAETYRDGGFRVYDIADRANPRLLVHHRTHGVGVHRFDVDARHAYISTEMAGYVGNILVVYDMANPAAPREIGRYAAPGQHAAGGETPTWDGLRHRLHHALRFGDELWAAWWHGGFRVLDGRDLSRIAPLGVWARIPAFPEPTHTVMPLPHRTDGRRYAVAVDEEHEHRHGAPHGFLWVFDVTDLAAITPIAAFDVSEMDSPYSRAGGRFGAHQFCERPNGALVHVAWFAGGLRVVDLADPLAPREVAHYVPSPRGGFPAPQSNDVDVDARGLIYLIDRNRGFDILERHDRESDR